MDGIELGVAVANGLGNAAKLLDQLRAGRSDLHFIEVMTCPGGCVGGVASPGAPTRNRSALGCRPSTRSTAMNRCGVSHKNAYVQRIYAEFLGQPLGEKSHHLLHTHYAKRETFI